MSLDLVQQKVCLMHKKIQPDSMHTQLHRQKIWVIVINAGAIRIFERNEAQLNLLRKFIFPKYKHGLSVSYAYKNKNMARFHYNPGFSTPCHRNEPFSIIDRFSAHLEEALWNEDFDLIYFISESDMVSALVKSLSSPVKGRSYFLRSSEMPLGKHIHETIFQRKRP